MDKLEVPQVADVLYRQFSAEAGYEADYPTDEEIKAVKRHFYSLRFAETSDVVLRVIKHLFFSWEDIDDAPAGPDIVCEFVTYCEGYFRVYAYMDPQGRLKVGPGDYVESDV